MWWSLTSFVYDNDFNGMKKLDTFRKRQTAQPAPAIACSQRVCRQRIQPRLR
jgi:hypothetical protein